MTGAELLLVGLRLHIPDFDDAHQDLLSMLVPGDVGELADLVSLTEVFIKEGRSHLRPWIACARQLEVAESQREDEVRNLLLEMHEKARALGWRPGIDLMEWIERRSGLSPADFEPARKQPADAAVDDGWA